jgi:hypothetical protein
MRQVVWLIPSLIGCLDRPMRRPPMPPSFEVSATLTSARVVAGDSVGLVITATNTGAVTIKVPVRYRLARIPCEGNGGVANGVMGIWGGGVRRGPPPPGW